MDMEKFTERSRGFLQAAQTIAIREENQRVMPEHLLKALMDDDQGFASNLIARAGGDAQAVRQAVDLAVGKQPKVSGGQGQVYVDPSMVRVLDEAEKLAKKAGDSFVPAERILTALAVVNTNARDALSAGKVTAQALNAAINDVRKGRTADTASAEDSYEALSKYARNLTEAAADGKIDPIIGRDEEIRRAMQVLSRRTKNNPVLIGEPGVGKTAIVEGLAQRIVNGDVPEVLRGKRLVEVNLNSMVAGAKYRGEFEERAKQLIDEVTAKHDELVLFIDELHTIVGAGQGGEEGGLDIANVLKPALARGELSLIGATTLNEYQKYIEKDAALERRFQPVFVPEPTVEQTIVILRGLRDKLEAHHQVTFADDAFVAAAELADRYITNRFLPDKAIDLIDQAAARVRIGATSRPADIQELEAEIAQLKREQDYATSRKRFDEAKSFEELIGEKQTQLEERSEAWERKTGSETLEVTTSSIAEVVSRLTGIPVAELTQEERQKLLKMEETLRERLIGQEHAVVAVSDAVRLSRAGLGQAHRPIATFLFLGPTGVGKTELAKALAESVFGDEQAIIRIDMSEYMERHAVARLIGAPPGYVGYDEGGQLTERVRRRPYSVILLDEIEKAHPDVNNVLLQVFDDGRLTDGKGRVVDFSNTIIIATSNLGASIIMDNLERPEAERMDDKALRDELMGVLKGHFRPEFLNRVDDIIVFHALSRDDIRAIVRIQLQRVVRTAAAQDISLTVDESLVDHLVDVGYQPEFGARELKRQIRQEVETRLAREILGDKVVSGDSIALGYDKEAGKVTLEKGGAQPPAADAEQTGT